MQREKTSATLIFPVLAGWFTMCVFVLLFRDEPFSPVLILGNDDAMRLVQIYDLLAGQPWFDHVQHRLGPEPGTLMHWSRFPDAPIAALLAFAQSYFGPATAEQIVLFVWPFLVLLFAVWGLFSLTVRLAGRTAILPAFGFGMLAIAMGAKFTPGEVDHHNVQIALTIGIVAAFATPGRIAAALAGLLAALSLAVGLETAPQIGLICCAVAVLWLATGNDLRERTFAFSATLAAATPVMFFGLTPGVPHAAGYCDALSLDLMVPLVIGSAGLAGTAHFLRSAGIVTRIITLSILGAVILAIVFLWLPGCLSHPYGNLPPLLRLHWLDRVSEARSLFDVPPSSIALVIGPIIMGLVGSTVSILSAHAAKDRGEMTAWTVLSVLIVITLISTLDQIRSHGFLSFLSVPAIAVLFARTYRSYRTGNTRAGLAAVAMMLFLNPVSYAFAYQVVGDPAASDTSLESVDPSFDKADVAERCRAQDNLDVLAGLPPGTISATSNLGAHILLRTHHRVLSAPYHRNIDGMVAQLRIALGSAETAQQHLAAFKVDYVAVCRTDQEYMRKPDDYAAVFYDFDVSAPPDFLELISESPSGNILVYRFTAR